MRTLFAVVVLVAVPALAVADFYRWTDSAGVVHFTDRPANVPSRYRGKMERIDPSVNETRAPGQGEMQGGAATAPQTVPLPPHGAADEIWQEKLAMARQELADAEAVLMNAKDVQTALRRKKAIYHRARDRQAYNAASEEVTRAEEKVRVLRERLAELESRAAGAGASVPERQ